MTAPAGERDGTPRAAIDPLRLLTAVGSPIALATALALYFGWVRSRAQADRFGADVSVFEMSPQDLVLRSIDVLFFPILGALLIGLGLVRVEPWLREHAASAGQVLWYAWILLPIALALTMVNWDVGYYLLPTFAMAAIAGMAYGSFLRRYAQGDTSPPRLANVALVGALLIATLFWQTERLARIGGEALADDLKQHPGQLPNVTLLSAQRLQIEARGVTETTLDGSDSAYRYRYDGLYLLQRSGEKYFLITDGWTQGAGRLLIFADAETIRLEFKAPPGR